MASKGVQVLIADRGKAWKTFLRFPYRFYKNNPNWVPPLLMDQKVLLNPAKHPFYQHAESRFFLALLDGKPAGRIAAILDHKHNEVHAEKTGFFGFFECIDDRSVSAALFDSARAWLKERGMSRFRGPVNPSQNEDCGLLLDDFDSPPVIMMTYNPPYYRNLIEAYGFQKAMDLYAYYLDGRKGMPEKLVHVAEGLQKRSHVVIRPADIKHFDEECKKIWTVYNRAWEKNWGFVPMTEAEFAHLAKNLRQAVVPELTLVAEVGIQPIGFSLALPDLNQALIRINGHLFPFGLLKLLWHTKVRNCINQVRIITMGVIEEYRNRGIDAAFYYHTWKNANRLGYYQGEMSWILENNTMMNRSAETLGAKIYRTYRMFEMDA